MMAPFSLMNKGVFPEVIANVVLSSDDDDVERACLPGQNALADHDVSVTDDARGAETTSVEAIVPGPFEAGASGSFRLPAIDRCHTRFYKLN
jgi:hypothetical protein